MHKAPEVELKILLTKEQFDTLYSLYAPLEFVEQHNYYYVTSDVSHYAYRVRVKEDETLFTLKQHIDGQVIEYEKIITTPLEEDEEVKETLASFNIFPPYQLMGELITQRAMFINELAELCFDINTYNGITDYEIEYEVKKEHDYQAAFIAILAKAGIEYVPNKVSKYKRCLNSIKEAS